MIKPLRFIAATALSLGALAIAAPAAHAGPPLVSTEVSANSPLGDIDLFANALNSVVAEGGINADLLGTDINTDTTVNYPG